MSSDQSPQHGRLSQEAIRLFEQLSPADRIRAVLSLKAPEDQRFTSLFWEEQCTLKDLKILSPTHSIATFTFKVHRYYCNGSGNLHGGAQATIFDMCTSLAVQAIAKQADSGIREELDSWINGGVSRVLTVNYLRPAPEGTDVVLECEVVQLGKSMGLLKGMLKRESDGVLLSTCDHTKAAVQSKPGWKI